MALDREAIYEALLARLRDNVDGVKTFVRRPKEFAAAEQPAILLVDEDETPVTGDGLPPRWKLSGTITVYARTSQSDPSPTTQINRLVAAVEGALEAKPDETYGAGEFYGLTQHFTNLGGLVGEFTISGQVEKYLGDGSGQALAVIPWEAVTIGKER